MLRRVLLFTLTASLVILLGSSTGQAIAQEGKAGKVTAFAPGQVLVRFRSGISATTAETVVAAHNADVIHRIVNQTFALAVPAGREESMVKTLESDPAIEYASLNYVVTELPADTLKSPPAETALPDPADLIQETPSCITDLWMSTSQQGEQLPENMVASGSPQVYVFFEYTDCDLEAIRSQIFYLRPDQAPTEIFSQEGVISGSGIQGIKAQAWPQFEDGTFPIGRYLTILSVSPAGGWEEAKKTSWHVSTFPNDYWFQGASNYQWNLHSTGRRVSTEADINMPQAWDTTTGGEDIVIAFVSTGVELDHPDLKDKTWTNRGEIPDNGVDDDENGCIDDVHGCEFFNGEANPVVGDLPRGWGTLTSGVAAAATNNEIGIAGVSWGARIMPIKVLRVNPDGLLIGYLSDLITAIDYATANGARIIHIGPRVEDGNVPAERLQLLLGAIDNAVDNGALVIAGVGDFGEPSLQYPAGFANVVAVGAIDPRNDRSWGSNYGSGIDLVAPGELILSTCPSLPYCIRVEPSTSLAAAHVEGVASLILSLNPDLSPSQVRTILRESAIDLGPPGYDNEFGHGKLDAVRALEATPHHLHLQTANLDDQHTLVFLLDDSVPRSCRDVWNVWTGPQTWILESDTDWVTVERHGNAASGPVPSNRRVCVDADQFTEPGTYQTTIKATSTLTNNEGPVEIHVTATYQRRLSRLHLSFIRRP